MSSNSVLLYRPKWSFRTPFTFERLNVLYYLLIFVMFAAAAYGIFESRLIIKEYIEQDVSVGYGELFIFLWKVGAPFVVANNMVIILIGWMRMIVRKRGQFFSKYPWFPTIVGWGGKISLVKLQGECPVCGGGLKFYSKQIDWTYRGKSGQKKVLEHAPVAECESNCSHWWIVDRSYN